MGGRMPKQERYTNKAKRETVIAALQDPENAKLSNREIALKCGVSHPFVANIKEELEGRGPEVIDPEVVDVNDPSEESSSLLGGSSSEIPEVVDADSNALVPFNYEGRSIRTVGGPLPFVAKDVCDVLDIAWQGSKTLSVIPAEWRGVVKLPTPQKNQHGVEYFIDQEIIVINEAAVYKLAFRSNKPEADRFTNWVASDVLPKLRKHGGYIVGEETMDEDELIASALLVAQRKIAEKNKLIAEQQTLITEQAPKVEIADKFLSSHEAWGMDRVSKSLAEEYGINIGRNTLFKVLREQKVLKENNDPYQEYVDRGYFKLGFTSPKGRKWHVPVTLTFGKGFHFIHKLLVKIGYGKKEAI